VPEKVPEKVPVKVWGRARSGCRVPEKVLEKVQLVRCTPENLKK
jgi:hypothetical protein